MFKYPLLEQFTSGQHIFDIILFTTLSSSHSWSFQADKTHIFFFKWDLNEGSIFLLSDLLRILVTISKYVNLFYFQLAAMSIFKIQNKLQSYTNTI